MSDATIGSELGKRRLALGLEKGQAADRIGMSRTTYSSYERDTQRPSVDVFPALANFLGVSIDDFLVLYGATCIAVVRESLERTLTVDGDSGVRQAPPVEVQHPIIEPAFSTSVEPDRQIEEPPHVAEQPDIAVTIETDTAPQIDELPYFTPVSAVIEVTDHPEVKNDAEWPRTQEVLNSTKVFGGVEGVSIYEALEDRTSSRDVPESFVISATPDLSEAFTITDFLDPSHKEVDPVIREAPHIDFREKSSKSKKKKKKGKGGKK